MALHARHPMIVQWDDHESANDSWEGGAENHQAGEGDWNARRAASIQAYRE
jgi:alkaline phosphatase D